MDRVKLLAIAVRSGKIGHVFLIDKRLRDWDLSRKASKSPVHAAEYAQQLINKLEPTLLVSERLDPNSRKSAASKQNIRAIAGVGEHNYLLDVSVPRKQAETNKVAEARELAGRFPEIRSWVPRPRRLWETEPRYLTVFEALGLAVQVIDQPDGQ
ncbi:MAG: hypothetical protein GY792_33520 [Gammaproteobacteria bacterium]|nr:hypothetical protein [Gammaproteobacteria bacterium]